MKKAILFATILALTFFGCSDKNEEPEVIKQLSASGALSFEAAGGSKTFAVTANIAWTVTGHESVAWLSITPSAGNGNETVTATATENTATTARSAELTITATGVTSVKVTVTQAAAPEKPAEPVKISLAAIGGVTPPVAGATPATVVTETAQYSGTIAWTPAAPAAFANSVPYTATITLTPKTGFTLTGVAQNFFTVAGATSATNPANSGVVTARFPSTGAATPAFVAVTDITGVPETATVGTALMLSGTVVPSNATNKSIVWTLKSGPANLTGGSTLTPTAAGTVVVTATIVNGASSTTPYTKEFTINVTASAPSFVAVTEITNVPTEATVGTPLTLSGTVAPSNATNKNITWSIQDRGTTGATINGSTLSTTAAGKVRVTATIANGASATTPYIQNFDINVTASAPAFVPVTSITGVPTEATAGTSLTLTGTVVPSNATNRDIVWAVMGHTANITDGNILRLTASARGTVLVTATIANGKTATTPYTQEFTINVTAPAPAFVPVTGITLASTTTTAGTPLTLSATVAPSNATNKNITWSLVSTGTTAGGAMVSSDGQVSATSAGNIAVRATIANGASATTPYIQPFDINVTPATLTVAPNALTFLKTGGTLDLDITSNTSWEISSDANWLTFASGTGIIGGAYTSSSSGTGSRKVSVRAVNYMTAIYSPPRTATITIKAGSKTETVTVTQMP